MLKFVQQNYKRSLWIFRVLLALFCALCAFKNLEYSAFMLVQYGFFEAVPKSVLLFAVFGIIYAIAVELLARLVVSVALKAAKIYTLPKQELVVWTMGALVVKFAVLAALNALYLLTPVITVIGGILFGFLANAIMFLLLWIVLKKLYFNDKNAPFVFKAYALTFVIVAAVSIFLAGGGTL